MERIKYVTNLYHVVTHKNVIFKVLQINIYVNLQIHGKQDITLDVVPNLIGNISLFSHDTQAVTSIRLNSSLVARAHFQTVRLSSRRSRWSEITRETITSWKKN